MKTSIATVCLSGGLSEKLQSIAAAGFRGVEIFESDLLSYNGTPADVAREMSTWDCAPSPSSRFAILKACRNRNGNGPSKGPNANST